MASWSLFRFALIFALAGLLITLGLFALLLVLNANPQIVNTETAYLVRRLGRILWPSSFWLMALEGRNSMGEAALVYTLSVGANILLYGILGIVVGGFYKGLIALRHSLS